MGLCQNHAGDRAITRLHPQLPLEQMPWDVSVSGEAELQREGATTQESVCRVTLASHWERHSGWGTGTSVKGAVGGGEQTVGHHGEQTVHKHGHFRDAKKISSRLEGKLHISSLRSAAEEEGKTSVGI